MLMLLVKTMWKVLRYNLCIWINNENENKNKNKTKRKNKNKNKKTENVPSNTSSVNLTSAFMKLGWMEKKFVWPGSKREFPNLSLVSKKCPRTFIVR